MTWIKTVPYLEATGALKKLYEQVKGPDNNVDNIMLAHSLRPHTMQGHMTLYKYTLHHPKNTIDKWFLECIGVYVSLLNQCHYCVDHHFTGMQRLLNNDSQAADIKAQLISETWTSLEPRQQSALAYSKQLTRQPGQVQADSVQRLKDLGWDDGAILEINQVVAYFNYANRTVLGLGVNIEGDVLGLSPNNSDDLDDWRHQ